MKTLKLQLILSTALATSLILIAAGIVVYLIVRSSLTADFDSALLAAARAVQSTTELDHGHIAVEPETFKLPEFSRRESPDYFEIWEGDGNSISRSPSLAGSDLHPVTISKGGPVFSSLLLPDGTQGRSVALTFQPLSESAEVTATDKNRAGSVTLIVARHTAELRKHLQRMQWILTSVCVGATGAAALTMLGVVRGGLRPLDALALQISRIDSQNLSERITLRQTPAELTAVVDRLNDLLDRLRDAMSRERGFTAAVAHELRTPLAGLEALLDVSSMRERSGPEYQKTILKCLGITRRMHAMTDNLLLLARADAGEINVVRAPINLQNFLNECWATFAERARTHGLKVKMNVEYAGIVLTSADLLRIVINNLFDNATTYADEKSELTIHAEVKGSATAIRIGNQAAAVDPAMQERVFDRFWRGDASRTHSGTHCGLGLSLCRQIVELIGGDIRVVIAPQGLFEVVLSVPSGDKSRS